MSQSMDDYYTDLEELRPTGEAPHVPDDKLSECTDEDPQRQRRATSSAGYPDQPRAADNVCRSCGASIPAPQTKCRFCLTNHLDGAGSEPTDDGTERTLVGIVHMIVESTTFYGAVAKGSAAANLLSETDTEQAIDACTLIYDLDDEPAPQLRSQWPALLAAVQVTSADGEQQLAAVRDRMGWNGQPASRSNQEGITRLYDESGSRIRDASHLAAILDNAGDEAWLVPAIALSEKSDGQQVSGQQSVISTRDQLECQNCGRETEHRFKAYDSIPDETWAGQPIWGCQACGTARYGQDPE